MVWNGKEPPPNGTSWQQIAATEELLRRNDTRWWKALLGCLTVAVAIMGWGLSQFAEAFFENNEELDKLTTSIKVLSNDHNNLKTRVTENVDALREMRIQLNAVRVHKHDPD